MTNPLRYVHSWPTVAIVAVVCVFVGGIFHFADAEGKASLLGVLCVLGTTAAAIAKHAFGVPKDKLPARIETNPRGAHRCVLCDRIPGPDGEGHLPACIWRGTQRTRSTDDDGPGEGGGVLAKDPPPTRPVRRSASRNAMYTVIGGLAFALGCSPSALQTHATIASVTGHVFDTACSEVETARSREQHAIADGPLDREESHVAVDAVRARWAPALASCELAADTHDAWATTLALAAAGAPFTLTDGLTLAQQVLSVWQSLSATLMIAGVRMPAVPAELVALVGGGL